MIVVTSAVLVSCGASPKPPSQSVADIAVMTAGSVVRSEIITAFENHAHVLPGDAEISPHGLFLARDSLTGTSWAVAELQPTKQAMAQEQSISPPFANGVLPSRPDPVVAITPGAVTLTQPKDHAWAVIAQGGVDWPCRGALPSAVWAAWHLTPSMLCRAEHAVPLRASLPNGSYFGYITAMTTTPESQEVVFDPETITSRSTLVDRYPYTYRLDVGAYTIVEVSEGFNAAAAHTYHERWVDFVPQLRASNTPDTPRGSPWVYAVTVGGGRATFVKQFSNVTPYCSFGGTDEPTSPSDRSPVTVGSHC